jgi:hypothetical protein
MGLPVGRAQGRRLAGMQNKVYRSIVEAVLLDRPELKGSIL